MAVQVGQGEKEQPGRGKGGVTPFSSFEGNSAQISVVISLLGDPSSALIAVADARRDIFPTTVVQATTYKGAPPRVVARPEISRYQELDDFLRRAGRSLELSDIAGARTELQSALDKFGWR